MLRLAAITALAFATAACVPGETPTTGTGRPAITTNEMPGGNVPSAATVVKMFASICGSTAPNFGKAPALLAAMPFALNKKTNVYWHRNLNLSFKVEKGKCSMVYRSQGPGSAKAIAKGLGTKLAVILPENGVAMAPGPKGTALTTMYYGQSYHRAILETQ